MATKKRSTPVSSPVEVSPDASLESLVTPYRNTEVVTTLLESELHRTLVAVQRYKHDARGSRWESTATHAALVRATMGLSRILSRWRQVPASDRNPGQPK